MEFVVTFLQNASVRGSSATNDLAAFINRALESAAGITNGASADPFDADEIFGGGEKGGEKGEAPSQATEEGDGGDGGQADGRLFSSAPGNAGKRPKRN